MVFKEFMEFVLWKKNAWNSKCFAPKYRSLLTPFGLHCALRRLCVTSHRTGALGITPAHCQLTTRGEEVGWAVQDTGQRGYPKCTRQSLKHTTRLRPRGRAEDRWWSVSTQSTHATFRNHEHQKHYHLSIGWQWGEGSSNRNSKAGRVWETSGKGRGGAGARIPPLWASCGHDHTLTYAGS